MKQETFLNGNLFSLTIILHDKDHGDHDEYDDLDYQHYYNDHDAGKISIT